jgi:hypothetical protein
MPQQRMDIRMIKDIFRLKCTAAVARGASRAACRYPRAWSPSTSAWPAPPAWTGPLWPNSTRPRSSAGCSGASAPRTAGRRARLRPRAHRTAPQGRDADAAVAGVPGRARRPTHLGLHPVLRALQAFAKTLKRSMRQQRRAGEKLFIDYAGPTLALADGSRGQVFVAAMGASSYTFACATADQRCARGSAGMAAGADLLRRRAAADRAGQPARADRAARSLRAASSTRRCSTSPGTTASRCCRRGPIRPQDKAKAERGAGRRALDPGAAAPQRLADVAAADAAIGGAAALAQRAALPEDRRQPREPVRRAGRPGAAAVAAQRWSWATLQDR